VPLLDNNHPPSFILPGTSWGPRSPPNNSMEPTRPAAANRVKDRFQELAGRLISRPLGRASDVLQ